jgi:carboxypeptidase C (cathepsin A)
MNSFKSCLLLLCLVVGSLAVLPPNYLFRPKHHKLNSGLAHTSPDFDYPLSQVVDKNLAKISNDVYPADIYTGYVPIEQEGSHIFYMLYPARGTRDGSATLNNSAPIVMWMQGGPGCADWLGNFAEIGPLTVINTTNGVEVVKSEINWNTDYNLLFIDQPPGVGFSPAGNVTYTDSIQAGKTVVQFLQDFFNVYTSLKSNPFYIFGESYAGHYIPSVASQLVATKSKTGLNLAGVGIGNGLTDPARQGAGYSQFGYMAGFLDSRTKANIVTIEQQIKVEFNKGNFSGVSGLFDDIVGSIVDPTVTGLYSPYSYRDGPSANLASPYSFYLDDANTRKAFALDPTVVFSDCADEMYNTFYGDIGQSYASNITYLLDQNVPVLLYNGEDDVIVNTAGVRTWIKNLGWQYIHQFTNSLTQTLNDNKGNVLGTVKTFKDLTFAVVYKAGHAVPSYQPLAAKLIADNLINGEFAKKAK